MNVTVLKLFLATSAVGGGLGLSLGVLFGNRQVVVTVAQPTADRLSGPKRVKNTRTSFQTVPVLCLAGAILVPLTITCLPLFWIDSVSGSCRFDRTVDKFTERLKVDINRCHQYDGNSDKYYAPAIVFVDIEERK